MNFWLLFSQNNWHNGGNSTEQYARTLKENCVFIHKRRSGIEDGVRFIYHEQDCWLPFLTKDSIAMFCRPTLEALEHMKIIKQLGNKVVYRAVDDWELWQDNDWYDQSIEQMMIDLADLSVSTSIRVANKYKIRHLPNACQSFREINQREIKTIGFIGDVDNKVSAAKFDIEVVIYLAKEFPQSKFLLCGSRVMWNSLPQNIEILPYCKWKQANQQLENIDVGLIPYYGEEISGVQPTKSWEYLSYGLPQLAREGLDLPKHSSVSTYKSYDECAKKLREILNTTFDRDSIVEFAKENTWQKRLEQLEEWLT